MSDATSTADHPNDGATDIQVLDEIVAGGWDEVIQRIYTTSQRLLEVAANIREHRKAAMDWPELQEAGLSEVKVDIHVGDLVRMIGGYRPLKRSQVSAIDSQYVSPFDSIRSSFPANDVMLEYMRSLDLSLHLTVDGVELLVKRPGMPNPTFEQIVNLYLEASRISSIASVLETAALEELSDGPVNGYDLHGVGNKMAKVVKRIIPPRCVPEAARLTLPESPNIDQIVAANLLTRFVMEESCVCYEFAADPAFDAADTHLNHGTIRAGEIPHHDPGALCIDNRLHAGKTNTELVIEHTVSLGIPLDFADGMVELAKDEDSEEFRYETDLIKSLFELCDSTSLAMRATRLYLDARFPASEKYNKWARERYHRAIEQLPEYQEFAPKPEAAVFKDPNKLA